MRSERSGLSPERLDLRPERLDLRPERLDLRPERLDLGPERLDLRPERPDLKPERPDLRPERPDTRPEGPDRGGRTNKQTDGRTDERTKVPLCFTGLRPLQAQILVPRPKSQSRGPNPIQKAQILASRPKF